MRKWLTTALGTIGVALGFCTIVPEALAFPHHLRIGDTEIYSEKPVTAAAATAMLGKADRLLRASPIASQGYGRRIFLTHGGWRWYVLAPGSTTAIAISRPVLETIIVNKGDPANDVIFTGAVRGGRRSLSGVIAHERTHGLIRSHFGLLADWRYPAWLREGYCDLVAGGGTLSDADAAMLKRRGETGRALDYYEGRKRVEAALKRPGSTVDSVFADARNF